MTVNRTTLLDLPLPVTGTESGTWGNTTNNGLTQYLDIAIAGMSNLTSANFTTGALTIETTEGNSSATNITATSGQYAGFRVTSLAQNSTITVGNTGTSPARSYRLINADATYTLTFKATGQTGITLQPGQTAVVAFNGTDYVIVGMAGAGTVTDNAVVRFDGTTGKLVQNSVVTIADSTGDISGVGQLNATTVDTTNLEVTNIKAIDGTAAASIANSTGVVSITANPVLSGGTANGVLYLNGSKVATSGSALTFDGTNLGVGGSLGTNAGRVALTLNATTDTILSFGRGGSLVGYILQDATGQTFYNGENTFQRWYVNATEQMRLTSTGLGIGTSSPAFAGSRNGLVVRANSSNGAEIILQSTNATAGTSAGFATAVTGNDIYFVNRLDGFYSWITGSGGNTERMRLDSSGNLGLGVTPSGWGSGKAIELGQVTGNALWGLGINSLYLTSNARWNGSNYVYTNNGGANLYGAGTGNGSFTWFTAPSGTAGNAISFTQAMTLDASGNLVVGTTATAQGRVHAHATANAQFVATDATLGSTYGGVFRGYGVGGLGGYAEIGSLDNGVFTKGIQVQQQATAIAFFTGVNTAGNTERARITSGGDLLVGTTVTNSGISLIPSFSSSGSSGIDIKHPSGAPSGDYFQTFQYNAGVIGSITQNGVSQVLYNISSDQRLKENIQDADSASGLIDALKVRQFDWKADGSHQRYGFVAQEMVAVAPEAVHQPTDPESMMAVDYSKLVPMLIKEVQSLRARVAALEGN